MDKKTSEWPLVVCYGPAQHDGKDHFLVEFATLCSKVKGAVIIGGDFNIIRKTSEKKTLVCYLNGAILLILSLK